MLSAKGGRKTRLLYYISPQIWSLAAGPPLRRWPATSTPWRSFFPSSPPCYADTALPVEFVGHPFVAAGPRRPPVAYDPGRPRSCSCRAAGSRRWRASSPPTLAGCIAGLRRKRPAVVIYPSEEIAGGAALRRPRPGRERRRAPTSPTGAPVAASAVLTSSGTMSLQCALAGIPGAIAYRIDPLTYLLGRWLVRVPYLGIANLLLGSRCIRSISGGRLRRRALAARAPGVPARPRPPGAHGRAGRAAARNVLDQPAGRTAGVWLDRHMTGPEGRPGRGWTAILFCLARGSRSGRKLGHGLR